MRYVDEFRDGERARQWTEAIHAVTTRPWTIMEVCGGQTHAIVRFGIDQLLPEQVELVHGPGCPVCVTPVTLIDKAVAIACRPNVIFCSFGDMLRVPGSNKDLLSARAEGADVRMVYSPMDALKLAQDHPNREVVFFAVGFETTAPANAMTVFQAKRQGIGNFSLLSAHVLVPPAMEAVLSSPNTRVQGFLAAGHVCTVTGYEVYHAIAKRYETPIVVTGFEPVDILQGLHMCLAQLEERRAEVENQYARAVTAAGNPQAQQIVEEVFTVTDRTWRGIGTLPASGLRLNDAFAGYDAETRFDVSSITAEEASVCISGEIMQGLRKPHECSAFGKECTPEHPLGAPMVSSEGACAAYHRYRRLP
jgi:hydrogenase expression/formation protein HypD